MFLILYITYHKNVKNTIFLINYRKRFSYNAHNGERRADSPEYLKMIFIFGGIVMKASGQVMTKKVTDLTKGNITKHILRFYWPLLLTSMLQQLYNFVDTLIVGRGINDNALASVGNMGSLFFLIVGFSLGLANGFGILIAQSFGAGKKEQLRYRLAATIQVAAMLTLVLTAVSVLFLPFALRLLRTDEVLMADCLRYGYIVFGGLAASIAYNVSAAVLRSLGDSRTPLFAIVVSSIVNLGLDCLFIFGFGTGVEGAAIATVVSQLVSAAVCIKRLSTIELVHLSREDFKNDRGVFLELLKNGLPMAFMNSITAVGCMVIQYFINGQGVDYTTAYTACGKYINLFMNPACAAGGAMSAFSSQNYGAGEKERIRKGLRVCLSIAFISYLILGSLMIFAPEMLARIMLKGSIPISLACEYLPISGAALIGVNCLFVYRSGVQGMGETVMPMWSGVLEMIMRIAFVSILMGTLGFKAVAIAEASAWISALFLNMFAFYHRIGMEESAVGYRKHRLLPRRRASYM